MATDENHASSTTYSSGNNEQGGGHFNHTLYVETPVLLSHQLSSKAGYKVYLKLENLQPPGSFKIRGISHMIQKSVLSGACKQVYCASGGNAGMAAAYASHQLNIPCTIILPKTTPTFIAKKLEDLGAAVVIYGSVYDEAKTHAMELSKESGALYVPAFEHPDIWEGHASMIVEASRQMERKPDVVIASVGGGGLFNGVVQGMRQVGWDSVPVLAMETVGANAFNAAIEAGELVTLPAITSIAKSLGSLVISAATLEYYKQGKPIVLSQLISDKEAVQACVKFAEDHRFLVEPACGASLAAVYSDVVGSLCTSGQLPKKIHSVLVIVCGGTIVSTEAVELWKKDFGL
ncbi:serine dehydratase [Plakobranchus ocellatus]|uniref:L-serine ammonia-lyase n=1 Tax=Plakobranchus ocellatus TaxID=259542 RepID=A0AAV4ARQ4_9GAST|nr:serine dehydratase [Plakobranchus ocellatus]